MTLPVAVDRFIRVVGGQVLAQVLTALGSAVTGYPYDTQYVFIGIGLGAAITAAEKYLRDAGVIPGFSLEKELSK
jgi:hypothetical protein